MRTYSRNEADLAFQWTDRYFKIVELIFQISGNDEMDNQPSRPSYDSELKFQELKAWFFEHQDEFLHIWSEFWHDKTPKRNSVDNIGGLEYFENPFLLLYKPDNLYELAYRLGMTENIDTWELTDKAAEIITEFTVEFSLEVLQFIHFVGEFAAE